MNKLRKLDIDIALPIQSENKNGKKNLFHKSKTPNLKPRFEMLQEYKKDLKSNNFNQNIENCSRTYNIFDNEIKVIEMYRPDISLLPTVRNTDIKAFNCGKDSVEFMITDVAFLSSKDFKDIDEEFETVVIVTGNTKQGDSVTTFIRGYMPYFYLSLPPNCNPEKELTKVKNLLAKHRIYVGTQSNTVSIEKKKPSTGFVPKNKYPYVLKFEFKHMLWFKRTVAALKELFPVTTKQDVLDGNWVKKNHYIVCESDEPEVNFMNSTGIVSSGWIRLEPKTYQYKFEDETNSAHHFEVHINDITPLDIKHSDIGNMLIDSVDIETLAENPDIFPDPENPNDEIGSIAHTIIDYNQSKSLMIIFSFGEVPMDINTLDGIPMKRKELLGCDTVYVIRYKNECEMLFQWSSWWSSPGVNTDIVIGWNIFGFDLKYLVSRIKSIYKVDSEFWGRIIKQKIFCKNQDIETKAFGFKTFELTPCIGKIFFDEWILFERDVTKKYRDRKMKTVAKEELKIEKIDLHHSKIKEYCTSEDPKKRGIFAFYNLIDTMIPMQLCFKNGHVPKMINIARVNSVVIKQLAYRGTQIQVYGGFHKRAIQENAFIYRPHYHPLLDDPMFDDISKKVSESYLDDIESIATTFSESGLFDTKKYWDSAVKKDASKFRKLDISDSVMKKDDEENAEDSNPTVNKFNPDNPWDSVFNKIIGIYSEKDAKKAYAPNSNVTRVGNFYNHIAEKRSKSEIEFQNNSHEEQKKKKEKEHKGHAGGYVIIPRKSRRKYNIILDWNSLYPRIMENFHTCPSLLVMDEEYANLPNVKYLDIRFNEHLVARYAYEEDGVPLEGVLIKHTCFLVDSRKIVQFAMNTFETRAMNIDNTIVKLFESCGFQYKKDMKYDIQTNEFFGIVSKDPSKYPINNEQLLHKLLDEEYEIFSELVFGKIQDYDKNDIVCLSKNPKDKRNEIASLISAKYIQEFVSKLETCEKILNLNQIIVELRKLKDSYIIQKLIYNSWQNALKIAGNSTFGFCGAGGHTKFEKKKEDKNTFDRYFIKKKGKHQCILASACITFVGRHVTETSKIHVEEKYGYKVEYADTDSLFIDAALENDPTPRATAFKIGKILEKELTSMFPGTMKIEVEKIAETIIYFHSKCYAYVKCEKVDQEDCMIEVKGLSMKKRDFCLFVKLMGEDILEVLLRKDDIQLAHQKFDKWMDDLVSGRIDFKKLEIVKKISKSTYTGKIGHVSLAKKIEKRAPGTGPKSGDTIGFVYIDVDDPENRKSMGEKIETIEYVKEHNLSIDYLWYIQNQIHNPIATVLEPVVPDFEEWFKKYENIEFSKKLGSSKKNSKMRRIVIS